MVTADQPLLTRALFNLLENAIKYSPPDACISLQVHCTSGWLICNVADQGKGISAEELPNLFSQYRSEEHTSELQSLMRISYAVFCLKKKKKPTQKQYKK